MLPPVLALVRMLHYILGITKAYTTRVGSGPSRLNCRQIKALENTSLVLVMNSAP